MFTNRISSTISILLFFLIIIDHTYGTINKITLLKYPEIANCGHPYEEHNVVTPDGYILTVLRVSDGNSSNNIANKPAVIFVPGLTCSASVWVNFGPENSLPCILAKNGYDSWLVNFRGTTWSRKHTTLDPDIDRKQYWNFNLHEISYYDIPAVIDYVLYATNQKSVYYVGHSQGNPIFFMMAAAREEYAKKVRLQVSLAPSVFVGNAVTPIAELLGLAKGFLNKVTKYYDVYELVPNSSGLVQTIQMVCSEHSPLQPLCIFAYLTLLGNTPHQVNRTLFPLVITNFPAGTSVDALHHSMQLVGRKLDRCDYGKIENLERYGQEIPPVYDITQINTPIAMYYSNVDYLVNAKNVDFLVTQLPNVVLKKLMKGFNHMDFLFGREAAPILFNHVLGVMNNYK